MFDVVVVGSANLDLVIRVGRHPTPGETLLGSDYAEFCGGKGLNQAVASSRAGATTAFIGATGDDPGGQTLRDAAVAAGVDIDLVMTVADTPSGRALITVGDDGENSIVVVAGANAHVRTDALPPMRVLLTQLEIPIPAVHDALRAGRSHGATTILNSAPASALSAEMLGLCDIVIPNEHEIELLGGADHLLDLGVGTLIVTKGAAGVDIVTTRSVRSVAASQVAVVDTTGAGDAFCGNIAARLAAGDDIGEAVEWAVVAAGLAVTRSGAVPSLPTSAEVRAARAGRASRSVSE